MLDDGAFSPPGGGGEAKHKGKHFRGDMHSSGIRQCAPDDENLDRCCHTFGGTTIIKARARVKIKQKISSQTLRDTNTAMGGMSFRTTDHSKTKCSSQKYAYLAPRTFWESKRQWKFWFSPTQKRHVPIIESISWRS